MPPLGFDAVPSPKKIRRTLPGTQAPSEAAAGVAAAGVEVPVPLPNSRRVTANAVHISGLAPGTPLPEPDSSHDSTSEPAALIEPVATKLLGATTVAAGAGKSEAGEEFSTTGAGVSPAVARAASRAGEGAVRGIACSETAVLLAIEEAPAAGMPARCLRGVPVSAAGALLARPTASAEASIEVSDAACWLPCPELRAGVTDPFNVPVGADEPGELESVEPPEPTLSANATGIAASADPTPSAIANAPTRPT